MPFLAAYFLLKLHNFFQLEIKSFMETFGICFVASFFVVARIKYTFLYLIRPRKKCS